MRRGSVLRLAATLALLRSPCVLASVLDPPVVVGLRSLLKEVVSEAVREHCPGKTVTPDEQVRDELGR